MSESETGLDWNAGALAEGLRCYCGGAFFEAHEHWESVWLTCAEPEKAFLQALIQIAAAFHHLQRGNHRGTVSLLRRSLHKLSMYPAEYDGVRVEALRASLRQWISGLEQPEGMPRLPYPRIR